MFGTRIAMLRKSRGMSQLELAKQLGVSASAVGMYEQGRREPPCQIIVALARLFDVSADFLLTGEIREPRDLKNLQDCYDRFSHALAGQLRLRSPEGEERDLEQEDVALLLAAILG